MTQLVDGNWGVHAVVPKAIFEGARTSKSAKSPKSAKSTKSAKIGKSAKKRFLRSSN